MNNEVEAIGGRKTAVRGASLTALVQQDTERRRPPDATLRHVFHVELRQFPHVARAFNLTGEELETRIVAPWAAGQMVDWGDRRWAPERARLTIYEGPTLRSDEIGLGRGWANATRGGEDVTARVLAEAQRPSAQAASIAQFKEEVLGLCGGSPVQLRETMRLAGALHPEWRVSDRLALAEQAIWELLHAGSVRLTRGTASQARAVGSEEWQQLLMTWSTWAEQPSPAVFLQAGYDGP